MKLPELQPEPMRPYEEDQKTNPTIWQPTWKCFCCQDTGEVTSALAAMVIKGYDYRRDRIPVCQAPDCTAGAALMSPALKHSVDLRITASICQELDKNNRESWHATVKNYQKQILKKVDQMSHQMNLRNCNRTPEEEQIAQRKHQENLLSSPKEQNKLRTLIYGDEL